MYIFSKYWTIPLPLRAKIDPHTVRSNFLSPCWSHSLELLYTLNILSNRLGRNIWPSPGIFMLMEKQSWQGRGSYGYESLKPASERTISSQHCSPPAPLSACKLIALAGSRVEQPAEFQGLYVLSESTWMFQSQEMESVRFTEGDEISAWWQHRDGEEMTLGFQPTNLSTPLQQVKKTSEATLTTIQDMVTIEDYDVSECFHHSRSTESVKSTVSETYLSKPSIAKRRANQQETEQFYFMVGARKNFNRQRWSGTTSIISFISALNIRFICICKNKK